MSESETEPPDTGGNDPCCVPVEELLAVRDLSKQAPWKSGNQYRLVCPECQGVQFTSKNLWKARATQYVIPRGDDEPVILYECPECDGDLYGEVDECPNCGSEIDWDDDEPEEQDVEPDDEPVENGENDGDVELDDDDGEDDEETYYDCPWPDCEEGFHGEVDECPHCEQPIEWEED